MILELNSYLGYEVDENAKISISVSDLYDAVQDARPHLWDAAQSDMSGETSIHDFGRILDAIVFRCAEASGDVELTPCCVNSDSTDTDEDTEADAHKDGNDTPAEGAIWVDPR